MSAKALNDWSMQKPIRRLLRDINSQEYFKEGGWTANPDEAKNFANELEVAQTCALYGLSNVELALRFESLANDVFCATIR